MKADNATLVRLKLDGSPSIPPSEKTLGTCAISRLHIVLSIHIDNADTATVSVAKLEADLICETKTGPADKPLFEALMGHPDQMLSLGQLELPPILSPSVHANAPGSTVAKYNNTSL